MDYRGERKFTLDLVRLIERAESRSGAADVQSEKERWMHVKLILSNALDALRTR